MTRKDLPRYVSRHVRCPVCDNVFNAEVSLRWYYREVRRTFGYPELLCVPCLRAQSAAEATGEPAAECRNPGRGSV